MHATWPAKPARPYAALPERKLLEESLQPAMASHRGELFRPARRVRKERVRRSHAALARDLPSAARKRPLAGSGFVYSR